MNGLRQMISVYNYPRRTAKSGLPFACRIQSIAQMQQNLFLRIANTAFLRNQHVNLRKVSYRHNSLGAKA